MSFVIRALPSTPFAPLFDLPADELVARGGLRRVATTSPGFPCRVSLRDAEPGETVLLVSYEHLPVHSPYRASYAIYVRAHAEQAQLAEREVPALLRSRLLAVRAFDEAGLLVEADVVDGVGLEPVIDRQLDLATVAYLHVHFARPGCFAARVDRC
jgi:hypothetical protein